MLERIRRCFSSENNNKLDGTVEVDETYISGKIRIAITQKVKMPKVSP